MSKATLKPLDDKLPLNPRSIADPRTKNAHQMEGKTWTFPNAPSSTKSDSSSVRTSEPASIGVWGMVWCDISNETRFGFVDIVFVVLQDICSGNLVGTVHQEKVRFRSS
jgi:hypothetical protein